MASSLATAAPALAAPPDYANTATVTLAPFAAGFGVDPVLHKAYVSQNAADQVTVLDTLTNTVITTIPVGAQPEGVALDPATHEVYVVDERSPDVSVIDATTDTVTATIPIDSSSVHLAIDPATREVFVPSNDTGVVYVIDEATDTVKTTIATGNGGLAVAADTANHKVYVMGNGGIVTVINAKTNTVLGTVNAGTVAFDMAADPVTHRVFIPDVLSNAVAVIDTTTDTVGTPIPLPAGESPGGVSVDPSTGGLFVSDDSNEVVDVVDESTGTVTSTPPAPAAGAIYADPASHVVYVGSAFEHQFSVLTPTTDRPPTIGGTPPSPVGDSGAYDFTYTLGGAPAPETTVTSGSLPPGLTLSRSGELSGTPTTPGTYSFTVTAGNGVGFGSTDASTIVVDAVPTISGSPGVAGVGEPYGFTFAVAGDPTPTVALTGGSLPPGLTLSPAGTVSGTPTHAGSYPFTVTATNRSGSASESGTLRVLAVPSISVGDANTVEGDSGTHPLRFTVSLSRTSTVPVSVHWRTANGTATAPGDYRSGSGTLTIAPGHRSAVVTVQVVGDRRKERTEAFYVLLSNAQHGHLVDGNANGVIVDDD